MNENGTDTTRARRMIEIDRRIGELNAEIVVLKQERAELEEQILDDFIETGSSKRPFNDATVYRRVDVYASAKDADPALLRAHGLGYVITTSANAQKLRSWIIGERDARGLERVYDANGNLLLDLPPALEAAIKITEKPSVQVSFARGSLGREE